VRIDSEDLIDSRGVADLLGLSQPNTVSQYQRRYPDMPRPIVDLGRGRCKLWLRSQVLSWVKSPKPSESRLMDGVRVPVDLQRDR
jgi:glutathione-regulated potassium-efflux system ancillary protein KefG